MKKIITSAIAILFFTSIMAQEKGDKYFGISFGTSKNDYEFNSSSLESKNKFIGLNYSSFVTKNKRLNFSVAISNFDTQHSEYNVVAIKTENNDYNLGVGYGILYPLLKNFYAEVTPNLEYGYSKTEKIDSNNPNSTTISNSYGLGVMGGFLWIPFKHFGLSTSLLSVRSGLSRSKQTLNNNTNKVNSSSRFTLTNSGSLQNQAFTIFYKF